MYLTILSVTNGGNGISISDDNLIGDSAFISGNNVTSSVDTGILVNDINNVNIIGNILTNGGVGLVVNGDNVIVSGNTVAGNDGDGMLMVIKQLLQIILLNTM